MDFGSTPEQLEGCRRSLAMSPPQSPAPATCAEVLGLGLVTRLQEAEDALRQRPD
jgi:hypothetical protein